MPQWSWRIVALTKKIKLLTFLILNFSATQLVSNQLGNNEGCFFSRLEVLDSFWEDLLENTSAGYTIYGEKPVYLGSSCQPEWLIPGSEKHKEATITFLSLAILESLPKKSKPLNHLLVQHGKHNSCSRNIEFMLINRKALFQAIKENHILFKYKFGHNVTPQNLLNQLTTTDHGFSALFGQDIALQGIVLGYGTDNSISYARATTFTKDIALSNPPTPPNKLPSLPTTEEEMLSRIETKAKTHWKKIKKETEDFSHYRAKNSNDKLKIPFSFHQNSKETLQLLKKYRRAETRLSRALINKNKLTQTLQKLNICPPPNSNTRTFTPEEAKTLTQALAHSLQYSFSEQISPEFIDGMKNAQAINTDPEELKFLEVLREQTFSSNKRKESLQFLQKVSATHCLISNKLYFSILKAGTPNSPITLNHKTITTNYTIRSLEGKILYKSEAPTKLSLENLISGLSHALLGMNRGETRKVYIHPDFAYGVHTEFGDGKALQIEIELLETEDAPTPTELSPLKPFDIAHMAPNITSPEEFESLQKRYNRLCGMKAWLHYKKAEPLIDLNDLIEELSFPHPLSDQERLLITKLNWNIYQQ